MMLAHPRPWRRDSIFSTGPRRPLSIGEQAIFRARLHLAFERRRLTRAFRDVGFTLLRFLGQDGRLDPTQATLAKAASCDPKTVRAALKALMALGMVRWQRRMVRQGDKARQTSNAYELIPDGPAVPPLRSRTPRPPGSEGNFARQGQKIFIKESLRPQLVSPSDQLAALAALDKMPAELRGRFVAAWQAMRGS